MRNRSNKFKYKLAQYEEDIPQPKRGEIVIIPMDNRMMDFAPYQATRLPEWWHDLPKGDNSIRRCQGTYDFISAGIVMPLWTDVTIRPNASGRGLEYRCPGLVNAQEYQINQFDASSTRGCPMENERALADAQYPKLVSPWRFRTARGVSLMVLPLLYENNPDYSVVPGIVHTDSYSQIHIVLNVLTDKEFTIPAGTPMQHMIPFKRTDDVKQIVFGNESMFKFRAQSGLGLGGLVKDDSNVFYRKMQRQMESEVIAEEDAGLVERAKRWLTRR